MSTHRVSPKAGYVLPSRLPKGPNGRALCRWCGTEVPKGRRTFCGSSCVHEHKLRSDPVYMAQQVYGRDRGVCATCGLDTAGLLKRIDAEASRDPNPIGARYRARRRILPEHGFRPEEESLWDADHIVPVVEGGGECGLEGMRTLCKPCHKRETAALAKRRAEQRRLDRDRATGRVRLL